MIKVSTSSAKKGQFKDPQEFFDSIEDHARKMASQLAGEAKDRLEGFGLTDVETKDVSRGVEVLAPATVQNRVVFYGGSNSPANRKLATYLNRLTTEARTLGNRLSVEMKRLNK